MNFARTLQLEHSLYLNSPPRGRSIIPVEMGFYFAEDVVELVAAVSKPVFSKLEQIELQKYLTWFVRTDLLAPHERESVTHFMARRVGIQPLRMAWMSVAHGALSTTQLRTYRDFVKRLTTSQNVWLMHGLVKLLEASCERSNTHHALVRLQPHRVFDDNILEDVYWLVRAADSYAIVE